MKTFRLRRSCADSVQTRARHRCGGGGRPAGVRLARRCSRRTGLHAKPRRRGHPARLAAERQRVSPTTTHHRAPRERPSMLLPTELGSPTDFDFFIGNWDVKHQRLRARLAGSTEWECFSGCSIASKILGGYGNIDDNILNLPSGTYRAATLRSFDPRSTTWSIWWLDSRTPGTLDVPVVGRFDNGVGTFIANDTFEGKPVVVRFRWSVPAPDSPRWEQAFSPDGGETWETNWIMEFTRRPQRGA